MKVNNKTRIAFFTILFLMMLSVFLNFYLYKKLKLYISVLYTVELDPLGLSYFKNDPPLQSGDKPVVVFFGDSRAEYWTAPSLDGLVFINRGLGNQTSAQVGNRFDAHVKPLQPDIVIIQVCINDLKTIPLFPDEKQAIVENCKMNIQRIVQNSIDIDAIVILTSVIPPTGEIPLSTQLIAWSDDIYEAVDEINDYILGMSGERLIVFDTAKLISNDEGKMKLEYSSDYLHLNNAGYQVLNRELEEILKEQDKQKQPTK